MHLSKQAIGGRLQDQRKQLGFIQENFAAELGISKRTLAAYEAGTTDIGAFVLAKAWQLGVDVHFVVTGAAVPKALESLSLAETDLLGHYRQLPDGDQSFTNKMISALAEAQ